MYYCGTDKEDRWTNPCTLTEFSSLPFCDETLSLDDRVADLLDRIPDDEKLGSAGTIQALDSNKQALP